MHDPIRPVPSSRPDARSRTRPRRLTPQSPTPLSLSRRRPSSEVLQASLHRPRAFPPPLGVRVRFSGLRASRPRSVPSHAVHSSRAPAPAWRASRVASPPSKPSIRAVAATSPARISRARSDTLQVPLRARRLREAAEDCAASASGLDGKTSARVDYRLFLRRCFPAETDELGVLTSDARRTRRPGGGDEGSGGERTPRRIRRASPLRTSTRRTRLSPRIRRVSSRAFVTSASRTRLCTRRGPGRASTSAGRRRT